MNLGEIITLVISSGLFSYVVFYRSKKRTAAAEAGKAEQNVESVAIENMRASAVEWKEIAEAREAKIVAKDSTIDRLYAEKNADREINNSLVSENAKLKLDLQSAQFKACSKRGCADREPQTGF